MRSSRFGRNFRFGCDFGQTSVPSGSHFANRMTKQSIWFAGHQRHLIRLYHGSIF
jgi:hypothetical protein